MTSSLSGQSAGCLGPLRPLAVAGPIDSAPPTRRQSPPASSPGVLRPRLQRLLRGAAVHRGGVLPHLWRRSVF